MMQGMEGRDDDLQDDIEDKDAVVTDYSVAKASTTHSSAGSSGKKQRKPRSMFKKLVTRFSRLMAPKAAK